METGGRAHTLYLEVRSTRLYLPLSHRAKGGRPATREAGDRTSDKVISQASWVPEYDKDVSVLSAALSDPDATSAARLRGGIGPRIRGL